MVGVKGSGFTVMLDFPLSVLEPVMELKRDVSSVRGIVTALQSSNPRGNKGTAVLVVGCHSTHVSLGWAALIRSLPITAVLPGMLW